MVPEAKKTWGGRTNTVTIGATPADGGTRANTVTIGGSATLPFLSFEGQCGRPAVAMEIWDAFPRDWPPLLLEPFGDLVQDPVQWAKKGLELGADLICLRLAGCHPDHGNRSPEQAAQTVKHVLQGVSCPLIIWGTGNAEKDNEVFPAVAEAAAGENCLIGALSRTTTRR